MFIGLNYINTDYIVAKYNSKLYLNNKIDSIETFENLSLSASEPLCSLDIEHNYYISDKYVIDQYYSIKRKYRTRVLERDKWQQWNLAKYKAEKILLNS